MIITQNNRLSDVSGYITIYYANTIYKRLFLAKKTILL